MLYTEAIGVDLNWLRISNFSCLGRCWATLFHLLTDEFRIENHDWNVEATVFLSLKVF